MAVLPINSGNGAESLATVMPEKRLTRMQPMESPELFRSRSNHLVLADGEIKLPARVVTLRIGIEPSGKRQAELDESAKRPDGPLRGATTS